MQVTGWNNFPVGNRKTFFRNLPVKLVEMKNWIYFVISFWSCYAFASTPVSFVASAPDSVAVNSYFSLVFTVDTGAVADFIPPPMEGFNLLGEPVRSLSTSVRVSGNDTLCSHQVIFTCWLEAGKVGEYEIAPAQLSAGGHLLFTEKLKIKVFADDPAESALSEEDFFVTTTAEREVAQEGEAFLLTYKIYTYENYIDSIQEEIPPAFPGLEVKEIPLPDRAWEQEYHNGKRYYTQLYKQYRLASVQPGTWTVPAARIRVFLHKAVRAKPKSEEDSLLILFFDEVLYYKRLEKSIPLPGITLAGKKR